MYPSPAGRQESVREGGLMNLYDIHAFLEGPWLLAALTGLGFVVGIVTGLFGVGGAFMITPLLFNMLGVSYTLAVGSSLSFTIGSSSVGWKRHSRLGNVSWGPMLILGVFAVFGTVLGAMLHDGIKTTYSEWFNQIMNGVFIGILLLVATLVWFGKQGHRDGEVRRRSLLQWLPIPPNIRTKSGELENLSFPGLAVMGVLMGVVKGLLGIGGGVLFMPILLLAVGLSMHKAVGTSLGVVLFSSLAGVFIYGGKGEANLWIVMPLLVGSSFGVQIGIWLCQKLHAARLQRCFALLVCGVVVYLGIEFIVDLVGGGGGGVHKVSDGSKQCGFDWLMIGLLVAVPLAWGLGMAYLFEWIRHVRARRKATAVAEEGG